MLIYNNKVFTVLRLPLKEFLLMFTTNNIEIFQMEQMASFENKYTTFIIYKSYLRGVCIIILL